jgi:hypothetical protein
MALMSLGNTYLLAIIIYRETRVKNVLNVSADGSLLTYNQTRLFHFSPETSGEGLSEVDTICTINLPIVVGIINDRVLIDNVCTKISFCLLSWIQFLSCNYMSICTWSS